MSEDEKIIDNFKYWFETNTENGVSTIPDFICKKLLDLYQQEKEKNKKLQIRCKELIEEKQELNTALLYDNIHKDKIRAILEKYKYTEIVDTTKIIEFYKAIQNLLEEN